MLKYRDTNLFYYIIFYYKLEKQHKFDKLIKTPIV